MSPTTSPTTSPFMAPTKVPTTDALCNLGTLCTSKAECTCDLSCCWSSGDDPYGTTRCSSACIILSDKRLKTDIHRIGISPSGIPVYTWKYREEVGDLDQNVDTKGTYFGAMAQDLLELAPNAVLKNPLDGYYRVNYSKIDVDSCRLV